MTSEKPASSKRAALPRASDYAKSFRKDWERLTRSGRYDMKRLKEAMLLLIANDGPLVPEWLDHPSKVTGPTTPSVLHKHALPGGRGGIRTHGWLPIAGFQDRCNRPLCHPSEALV
jgi:hypothetical protein